MNNINQKNVAIVASSYEPSSKLMPFSLKGAGPFGLASAKYMLEQNIIPTVFEKCDKIGGVWRKDKGNVWPGMKMNATKYCVSFSDFEWDSTASLFPTGNEPNEYFEKYVQHFNISSYLKFNCEVLKIHQLDDKTWNVKWKCTKTNELYEDIYDFVVVACGMFTTPYIPDIQTKDNFKGLSFHSKEYPIVKGTLNNKTVLVVGNSNSGVEVSGDLAFDGARVVNAFHEPRWVLKRCIGCNQEQVPLDFSLYTRKTSAMLQKIKTYGERNVFRNRMFSRIAKEQLLFKELYIDTNSTAEVKVSISDKYMNAVKMDLITLKKTGIASFDEKGVYFEDDSYLEVDAIIWCTGYRLSIDIFEDTLLQSIEYEPNRVQPFILFKSTFPRDVDNIAFINLFFDSNFSFGELQARWASLAFSGKYKFPTKEVIDEDLEKQRNVRQIRPPPQTIKEDFLKYTDELALEVGVLPDFEKIKMTDEDLYKNLFDRVAIPVHYRIDSKNKELASRLLEQVKKIDCGTMELLN